MDLGLQGKTAVVTGGASSIGKAIVEGLCAEGASVVIADFDEEQAKRVVAQLRTDGYAASFIFTDVGDRAQVERLVEHALKEHEHIDILVNGAGWTVNGLFLEKPVEDWEREVAVNLWGPIYCTRAVAPSMVTRGYGKIINIGSDAGRPNRALLHRGKVSDAGGKWRRSFSGRPNRPWRQASAHLGDRT